MNLHQKRLKAEYFQSSIVWLIRSTGLQSCPARSSLPSGADVRAHYTGLGWAIQASPRGHGNTSPIGTSNWSFCMQSFFPSRTTPMLVSPAISFTCACGSALALSTGRHNRVTRPEPGIVPGPNAMTTKNTFAQASQTFWYQADRARCKTVLLRNRNPRPFQSAESTYQQHMLWGRIRLFLREAYPLPHD
ncbi:unnamed protein product [Protopolystoma xenopodis]|uniref:Uncharacterized protein n=1 Tax=Protopolystoma xenopodis TaxID=117903 RepID=A0A3S4ZPU8_9PLAT|nr:unnamed protein product [Protopolystoma xenopodis]